MKGLAQDMGIEMRDMREIMKAKAERLSDEIKKRMMRWIIKKSSELLTFL